MKNVVVTGGAGFIGSHLVEELFKLGYQVTILDNLYSGKISNIEAFISQGNGRVRFVRDSITNTSLLETLFRDIDYVFHLAAIASVPFSVQDPMAVHQVNLTGTLTVLDAARKNSIKKVVMVSSAAVYGDSEVLPQSETHLPMPQSPYAVTKLSGEYYCRVFSEIYGLDTACLRYFNVYGPRQDPNSQYAAVIPKFISLALDDSPPVIFGDGEQTRDFVYVKDAINAAIMAAESNAAGVYNIATGKAVTVNELTNLIIKYVGKELKPVYKEARPGEIMHSIADISRAKEFDFTPKYSLAEGLRDTVAYYIDHVK